MAVLLLPGGGLVIYSLIPLLVVAGLVALVVAAVGRRGSKGAPSEAPQIRRFFQYAALLGTLIVVAIGLTEILEQLLQGGDVIQQGSAEIARSLAFLIVGIPVYGLLGSWILRQLRDPAERTSFGWSFYLTATLLTAVATASWAAFEILYWAIGSADFEVASVARLVVWGAVWLTHWALAQRLQDAPRGHGHMVGGSLLGLIWLAGGTGGGLATLLDALYSNLFEDGIADAFGADLGMAAASFLVGLAVFWLYWVRHTLHMDRIRLWRAYVLLVGVLGGLVAFVGAASTMLYTIFEWWFGEPGHATAARQFSETPVLLTTLLLGLAAFGYHRLVIREGSTARTEMGRVYDYVVSGIGLFAAAGGVTVLLVALIRQLSPAGGVIAGGSEVNTLIAAITSLLVGGPIWYVAWSRLQRLRAADPNAELRSTTRRTYLTILFGIGGLTATISLIVVVFRVIEDLLESRFGAGTIDDVAISIALTVTAGVIAGYHWMVHREDRAIVPAAAKSPVKEVILLGILGEELAATIKQELDARVVIWDRPDAEPVAVAAADTMEALEDQTEERVLVMAGPAGPAIVPFKARQ